jgi:hypothetical protein
MTYEYLLINAYHEFTLRYVNSESAHAIKSLILDSGVHSVFHRFKLKEYPGGYQRWIERVVNLWSMLSKLVGDSYAVVPDYPADYEGNEIEDNVERTFRNIEYAVSKYPYVRWIIPLQGKKDDAASIIKSFEYVRDLGLLERYNYIAISPTCTTYKIKFLRYVAKAILKRVKQIERNGRRIKIHMFGTTMKAWRHLAPLIDSTDAVVSNYLCMYTLGRMCSKKSEKESAWRMFLERASQVAAITRL